MILLRLFLTFLKIGAVSFGGGYGMISIIRDECLNAGWLTEEQLINFIAVAESTPGPIAVNMATFVGASQAGLAGALLATLGVVIPSFFIILLIAAVIGNLLKIAGVRAALDGVAPAVVALILSTAATTFLSVTLSITSLPSEPEFDYRALIVFAIVAAIYTIYYVIKRKAFSPVLLIIISGIAGAVLYA